jgi:hypothetical protein
MPTYSFRDTNTNEVFDQRMSWDEKVKFLEDNPHFQSYIGAAPGIGDPHRLGLKKPDDSFRDILRNVKHKHDAKYTKTTVNTF